MSDETDVPVEQTSDLPAPPPPLTLEELPDVGREFIPNKESGGTYVFAKEGKGPNGAEGYFTFFTGQPVFLPKTIAKQLGEFFIEE
jgi:hypothetical protein